ncbi:chaperone protein TorD [bacterium BMS3Abin01]|nr:chaperone protein TorD [bacterium BMS3Abin01]HDZ59942.1 hypothetical protein [Actinomycetota bacterium]
MRGELVEEADKNSKAENSLGLINIYSFLATIYNEEITAPVLRQIRNPRFLEALSSVGVQLDDDMFKGSEDRLVEDLAVEYARLFLGPGKHIPPYESVHHERTDGDWGSLWGADTVAVKKFIESTGLEYRSEYDGLPDHIGVELEFMKEVTRREAQAWEEKDEDGADCCLKIKKKFIEEHLARWIPVFCDKVIAAANLSFYREIAAITKSFIEFERKETDRYLSRV